MNDALPTSAACLYAIKLSTHDTAAGGVLAGRLEHVQSGRRHDFANGAELLAWLTSEQSEAYSKHRHSPAVD